MYRGDHEMRRTDDQAWHSKLCRISEYGGGAPSIDELSKTPAELMVSVTFLHVYIWL